MKLSIGTAQFGMNYGICNTQGVVSIKEVGRDIRLTASYTF